jgi:uncharacterized protein DUF2868
VSFDENAALEVTAVRAIESTGRAQALWNDADRAWASRAAAELVGEGGAPEAFLAARARLALQRLADRAKVFSRAVRALRWRPWVSVIFVTAAIVAGMAIDQVGGSQQINLLAPPFIAVLVWNIAVYAVLVVGFILRYGDAAALGPMRSFLTRIAGGHARHGRGELGATIAQFVDDWSHLSAPLYAARAARIFHLAAAAFAAGVVAGLYMRGLAFEYRATWESTFLSVETVRAVLAVMLAPGGAITGIPMPSLAEVEAIRTPAGENAARWLHLMAATAALVVIVPRLVLALWAWVLERHRATHLPIALESPYFARLLRGFRGGPMFVRVTPYSYNVPPAAAVGLERVIRSVFGTNASLTVMAPVAYGGEDALAMNTKSQSSATLIALFNATATPEVEAHGAFLDRLGASAGPGGTLVALVDESAFRDRWGDEPARLEARRTSWRALCADRHVACAFAALTAGDVVDAAAQLEHAIEEAIQ